MIQMEKILKLILILSLSYSSFAQSPKTAAVETSEGRPVLFVDNKPPAFSTFLLDASHGNILLK